MAKYFRLPFAVNGDKKDVPDTTQTTEVSYNTGYSQDYQRNPESDPLARRVERNYFNDIIYQVTDTLKGLYETGVPPFITAAENDGTPFSYSIYARVRLGNRIYESTKDNNTTTPPASGWVLVDFLGLDERYLNESSNLSDLPNKATARTNLDVYSRSEGNGRYLDESSNLSDLPDKASGRNNLQVYSKTESDGRFLNEDSNLSDLPDKSTAIDNLELDKNYIKGNDTLFNRKASDIDDFYLSGVYRAEPSSKGVKPTPVLSGFSTLFVFKHSSSGNFGQLWMDIGTPPSIANVFYRIANNKIWGDWRQFKFYGDRNNKYSSLIEWSPGISIPSTAIGVYITYHAVEDTDTIVSQRLPNGTARQIMRFRTGSSFRFVGQYCMIDKSQSGTSTIISSGNLSSRQLAWIYEK